LGEQLHRAAARQDIEVLKALLSTTGPMSPDALGEALATASDGGWVEGIDALLAAGADPDWHPTGATPGVPLAQAIYWRHLLAVERLLDTGAAIEARDYAGRTPLHQAVYAEVDLTTGDPPNADVTDLLVRRGADVFARTPRGETALDLATILGHPTAQKLLRQRMAERANRGQG
jgi:ankyrin repeat protein